MKLQTSACRHTAGKDVQWRLAPWSIAKGMALTAILMLAGFPVLAENGPERLTTVGIFNDDGQLVRQWSVLDPSPPSPESWDGLDDRGNPVDPGQYQWRSAAIEAGALRSRWATAIGADPARNADGHPVYFPGAISGTTRLESDGESLYLGAPVGDASDIMMKTDLSAETMLWNIDLYQPSLHSVGSLRMGGADGETLFVLQRPNRIHRYSKDGRELSVHHVPEFSHQDQRPDPHDQRLGWNSQLAVNRDWLAVSYPNEDKIRFFSLDGLKVAAEVDAPSAEHLCFLADTGRGIAFVSAGERRVYILEEDGDPQALPVDIEYPHVIRRHGRGLVVATDQGGYLIKADPDAHGSTTEKAVAKHGGQIYILERDGTVVRTFGTGKTNYEGPWQSENLNGVKDFAIADGKLIALDWPNRLVYFDFNSGELLAERFLSEGSYFTLPIAVSGRNDRLWVRGIFGRYLWKYAIDLEAETWEPLRLVVNTASNIGATQSNYYRLFTWRDRLFVAGDAQFDLARIKGNRTFPVLRLHSPERPEGVPDDKPHYMINKPAIRGAAELRPRPRGDVLPPTPIALFGAREDGRELMALGGQFSPHLFRIPADLSAGGVPVPEWGRAEQIYDATSSFPGLDLYQLFPGVYDDDGSYYGTFGDRNVAVRREKDQHLYWPGVESASSILYKISPVGQVQFEVGRVQTTRLERHGFVQPVVSGVSGGLVFVTDRARPGQQVYTDDGLFIGDTWSDNRPDEVPPTLQDPYTRADIMRGAIVTADDGRVFHAQANINRVDLYEILGVDDISRDSGAIEIEREPVPARAAGEGLAVTFYSDADFAKPIESRVEPVRHHNNPNMWDHTWLSWPENSQAAVWKGYIEVPVTDDYTLDLHAGGARDHVRLELNDRVLLDGPATPDSRYVKTEPLRLQSGRLYPIEIRYRKGGDQPVLRFNWQTPSRNRQTVPTEFLYNQAEQ